MSPILEQLQQIIQNYGAVGYLGIAGMIIIYIVGFVSVWLTIGMLIYSLFSKNWAVWRKWKYVGYSLLLGVGLLIIGLIIQVIIGAMSAQK